MVNPYVRRAWDELRRLRGRLQELAPETTEKDVAPFGIREAVFAVGELERRRPRVVRVSYNPLTDEIYGVDEEGRTFAVRVKGREGA